MSLGQPTVLVVSDLQGHFVWKGICHFRLVINNLSKPYLAAFSHNSAYWPLKSSKVNAFYIILKLICHFLLLTNTNLGVFHRFRDMASFPLKKAHFSYPRPFNPGFENVSLAIYRQNFACLSFTHTANYSCKKFSPMTYSLAKIHPLQTDGQTDKQTDDNSYQ